MQRANFGDSVGNTPKRDVPEKNSSHVFDGAGENIQCLSDSESLASSKTKSRYINPAIYIETVESTHSVTSLRTDSSCNEDVTPHPHSSCRSRSTPLLSSSRKSCRLNTGIIFDGESLEQTARDEPTYRESAGDTFRLSVASLSTNTTAQERARNEFNKKKHEAFRQWLVRKDEDRHERARLEKLKLPELSAPTQHDRDECFRRWLWRKQAETAYGKVEVIVGEYRDKRRRAELHKREKDNEQTFTEWTRRKEEEMKALKSREQQRAARAALAASRRRAGGERAFRDWVHASKHKPLPVPLNKGELSMRGSISEMYKNPIPWQSPT